MSMGRPQFPQHRPDRPRAAISTPPSSIHPIRPPPPNPRPMEPVQAAENPAGADVRHGDWRLGYPLVAAPVIALCAGILDGRPWAAGFAFGLLLLGVGSIWRDMLALERAQAERGRAAVNAALDNHHEAAVLHDRHLIWRLRLGYFVLAPVMSVCAGLLDGPSAGYFAYAPLLLLGVASIGWSLLPLPPRPPQRVRRPREGGAAANDAGNHQIAPPEAAIAWCGYVLVAAPVMGASFGLADTAAAALVSYALVLLGFAFLSVAMLPLRPMERILREEDRPVRNDNFVAPRARGMDWTGYFFVAAPVMASCAGLVDGLAAAHFFYALHLLGVVFIIIAMLALAKQNMA